ncbi:peptidyl-tRNA hydrolase 2, mitochondrial [Artemisia annua]|uniref:peptidyl-tRNA hydrolase n=1 Tax=Artemisia annua TaxID=35608 RepID=A0A2U1P1F9_ARTAN|nr:peptidyl-tRNA hydrolase 2, mitochondrial [Artemisia annua]
MVGGSFHPHHSKNKKQEREVGGRLFGGSFKAENFIPGLVIGFVLGLLFDLSKPIFSSTKNSRYISRKKTITNPSAAPDDDDLKMVLVVRQDLKMGQGKIASQCAHAATGLYSRLMQSHRNLLHRWEHGGQAKIVVTCKNQQEMNKLQEVAEGIGLPTYVIADAGRTQVSAGSRTVLAIGPGKKSTVDSVTGKQRLL